MAFEALTAEAEPVRAGSEGLLFLPYLTGERTPYADPLARGAFVGLTVRHSRPHMTRAVLEGVAFGLRDSFELMKESGLANVDQVRLSGGGARSKLWRQILADVLQTELVTVNTTEGAAYGAALLACVGAGYFADVQTAVEAFVTTTDRVGPGETVYDEYYGIYRSLYGALKVQFRALAAADS
jgi:xylulokinase